MALPIPRHDPDFEHGPATSTGGLGSPVCVARAHRAFGRGAGGRGGSRGTRSSGRRFPSSSPHRQEAPQRSQTPWLIGFLGPHGSENSVPCPSRSEIARASTRVRTEGAGAPDELLVVRRKIRSTTEPRWDRGAVVIIVVAWCWAPLGGWVRLMASSRHCS